jgi:hypothetical protein
MPQAGGTPMPHADELGDVTQGEPAGGVPGS